MMSKKVLLSSVEVVIKLTLGWQVTSIVLGTHYSSVKKEGREYTLFIKEG